MMTSSGGSENVDNLIPVGDSNVAISSGTPIQNEIQQV